jgi:hypothetical protein
MTSGTVAARPMPTIPTPDSPKARGTVTAGPSVASRPKENAPIAVPSEAIALAAPIVAVDRTPMPSSTNESWTMRT